VRLTDHENEILYWLLVGKSERDIAGIYEVSRRTVRVHKMRIAVKLRAQRTGSVRDPQVESASLG
jgi:DNA-binding CsgD family transcriptional regulator